MKSGPCRGLVLAVLGPVVVAVIRVTWRGNVLLDLCASWYTKTLHGLLAKGDCLARVVPVICQTHDAYTSQVVIFGRLNSTRFPA